MVFQRVRPTRICGFASVSPSGRHVEVREKKGLLVNTDHTVRRKQPRAQEPEQTVSLALPLFPSRRSSCIHWPFVRIFRTTKLFPPDSWTSCRFPVLSRFFFSSSSFPRPFLPVVRSRPFWEVFARHEETTGFLSIRCSTRNSTLFFFSSRWGNDHVNGHCNSGSGFHLRDETQRVLVTTCEFTNYCLYYVWYGVVYLFIFTPFR